MQTIQDRIDRYARRYRVARKALLSSDPRGDWTDLYLHLTDDDNQEPMKELAEIPLSDGQCTPSWIWRSNTTTISRDKVNKDMRVEWAQCAARADRWEEEVTLLQEEMRRVVEFLEWKSGDWLTKADLRTDPIAPAVRSGLSAYANKQTAVYHNLTICSPEGANPMGSSTLLPSSTMLLLRVAATTSGTASSTRSRNWRYTSQKLSNSTVGSPSSLKHQTA